MEPLNEELERLKNEHDALVDKLNSFITNLHSLNNKRETAETKEEYDSLGNEINYIKKIRNKIYKRLNLLIEKYNLICPPVSSDGEIELRMYHDPFSNDIDSYYDILLCGSKTRVGYITYRGYHTDDFCGDVGYGIEEEYRGNGYACKAMRLLGDILKRHNIDDFWVSAYNDNIPSIKSIIKYGGEPINKGEYFTCFCAKTYLIEKDNTDKKTI